MADMGWWLISIGGYQMALNTFEERKAFANENNYLAYREYHGGKWVALNHLMFTTAIVGGYIDTLECSVDERWCYHKQIDAVMALVAWEELGFVGEPKGWHRHPYTGRRRPNGEPSLEYIDP
jgi:hypothetical protein